MISTFLNLPAKRRSDLLSSSLGNVLEWFDFALFIFFAPIIGEHFFPVHSPASAAIAAFAVFAGGFLCRPLGGIVFGHFGDRYGRVRVLRASIALITLATLLTGLLPAYETLGVLSSVLFAALRLLQGLSVGGEYSGVMIYLAETAPEGKRGMMTSFAAVGANFGFLIATLLTLFLQSIFSKAVLFDWAWRIPFFVMGTIGLLVLYFRFSMRETQAFLFLKQTHHIARQPFREALSKSPTVLLRIVGLTAMGAAFYYVFFGYMPSYLHDFLNVDLADSFGLQAVFLAAMLFLVPFAGRMGDHFGRRRMLLFVVFSILILSWPMFYLIQTKVTFAIAASLLIATFISSLEQGNTLIAVVEQSSVAVRYSTVAFSYNLGQALFGGTAPLIISLLTQHYGMQAAALYLMLMAGISALAIWKMQVSLPHLSH